MPINRSKRFPERRTWRCLVRLFVRREKRSSAKKYRYITWPCVRALLYVYMSMYVCVYMCACVYQRLTLWCCMMAVDFRFADIFSSPGCPLCSSSEREMCAHLVGLSTFCPAVRLLLTLSFCLRPNSLYLFSSFYLPLGPLPTSLYFSPLLTSHRRPLRGSTTITNNTKEGWERGREGWR